jgi:hypothetical protein
MIYIKLKNITAGRCCDQDVKFSDIQTNEFTRGGLKPGRPSVPPGRESSVS